MFWKHLFQPPSEIADPEIVDIVLKTPWDSSSPFSLLHARTTTNSKTSEGEKSHLV
jgi:hypothetical protein